MQLSAVDVQPNLRHLSDRCARHSRDSTDRQIQILRVAVSAAASEVTLSQDSQRAEEPLRCMWRAAAMLVDVSRRLSAFDHGFDIPYRTQRLQCSAVGDV